MQYDKSVSISLTDLILLANRAKNLSLAAKHSKTISSGTHHSRLLGRGMEFAETRRYHAGDDIRTIDWRVTARTGKPHTKLFSTEKERMVYACVDMRSPMFFATQGVFKSVQAATLAAYISWHTAYQGDRIGGIIFNDQETMECRPARGKKGVLPFLQALSDRAAFSPDKIARSNSTTMDGPMSHLRQVVRPGSAVFIISDFRQPAAAMGDHLFNIATHSDVILCFLHDPIEEALPANYYLPVVNGSDELELNTYKKNNLELYHKKFTARKETIKSFSHHPRIHFLSCSTKDDCFEILRY